MIDSTLMLTILQCERVEPYDIMFFPCIFYITFPYMFYQFFAD